MVARPYRGAAGYCMGVESSFKNEFEYFKLMVTQILLLNAYVLRSRRVKKEAELPEWLQSPTIKLKYKEV
jgi:hypothetical protein